MSTAKRRYLIAGNWKMYKTGGEARQFVETLAPLLPKRDLPDILLCPPFTALIPALEAVQKTGTPIHIGAQTMESRDEGAFTGEISPRMLKDLGVRYVILGHSERRQYYNETDQAVNAKAKAALTHDLIPIVCVGESLEQREQGITDRVVSAQIGAALEGISPQDYPRLVFAYEPIWAIGTGKTCETPEASRVCGLIRKQIAQSGLADATRILYGGSMKPANSAELLAASDIDGGLIGGASLEPASFAEMIAHAMDAARPVSV